MSANIYLEKSVLAQSLLKDVIVDLSKEPVAIATLFIFTTFNSTKKNQKSVVALYKVPSLSSNLLLETNESQLSFITSFFHCKMKERSGRPSCCTIKQK
jgi:hypothetical protein